METLIIEILKKDAYDELKQMEESKKIHIRNSGEEFRKEQAPQLTREERRKRLEALQGSLSHLKLDDLLKELEEMRNEWERDI